jgi:hypothetical protein
VPTKNRNGKMDRREFSTALLGAIVFSRSLIFGADESRVHPSMLLCAEDPFSGLGLLKARYASGRRPSEDIPGWALSWQLTKGEEFAERAIAGLRAMPALPKDSASRWWMQFVGVSLAFDWLYEHPAFDAKLKDQIAGGLVDAAGTLLARPDLSQPE